MSATEFVPRWSSPPGETIREALDERGLTVGDLSSLIGLPSSELGPFLGGEVPMTIRVAEKLASNFGGSVEFWMTRDSQYREDRARVTADRWAQELPFADMVAFGWVAKPAGDWVEQIDLCLDFFDVESAEVWQAEQAELSRHARFRSSATFEPNDHAVAAWLRRCEIELSRVSIGAWDRARFAALLPELRPLTREPDPAVFLPELRSRCAAAGVAVGVVRAPLGCPMSGAAGRLANGSPGIALSGRHRADDHFWFTFFHEAAHLVLHDVGVVYLDEIEKDSAKPTSRDEAEADAYAGALLVPKVYETRLARAADKPFRLRSLADEIGVSPGILVGHLQHRNVLDYATRLNKMKRRYRWAGTSLERA